MYLLPKVLDLDPYTGRLLVEQIEHNFGQRVSLLSNLSEIQTVLDQSSCALLIVNFRLDHEEVLSHLALFRMKNPALKVIMIAAKGEATRTLKAWEKRLFPFDRILPKPLAEESLRQAIKELTESLESKQKSEKQEHLLNTMVPDMKNAWQDLDPSTYEPHISEQAILVTDVRNSTDLILSSSPHDYFNVLNLNLRLQARIIAESEGMVVKFVGDGLIASFSGMARTHRALRAAFQIVERERSFSNPRMGFGIGVAEGLVLNGIVGMESRWNFDIIGSTVHLASRLCNHAKEAEVCFPKVLLKRARYHAMSAIREIDVEPKGFKESMQCCLFSANNQNKPNISTNHEKQVFNA